MGKGSRAALSMTVIFMLAFIGAGYLVLRGGFSARESPSAIEAFLARRVRNLAIPRDGARAQNPIPASPEVLAEAMEHFADHCAFCHANDGSGSTPIGQGMYPKPPDMRQAGTQDLTDGEIYYIIHNGIRLTGMPAFGEAEGGDEDSWKLVHFIRHLPNLTAEEQEQMKQMNPKSPAELKEEEEIRRFLEGNDDEH